MSRLPLDNLTDDDVNGFLDEIDRHSDEKTPQFENMNNLPRLNRQLSFTALKHSVFDELHEQDHVEEERISWYKLRQYIEFEWFDKLYQNNKIKQHYLNDIKTAKINYKSYTDKILIKYFHCPFKANKSNQSAQAYITNSTNGDAFVHFNFPYYFPKGLHHYVLFSRYNIINSLGHKQMRRLISNYIEDKQYNILSSTDNNKYEFVYYEERDKLSFFCNQAYEFEQHTPLLSEIIDTNIIPNIIHVFIMVSGVYRVHLGANNATWADESFLWKEACDIIKSKDIEKFGRQEKWLRKYIQDRSKGKKSKNSSNKENEKKEKDKQIGFNSIRDKILIKEFKCKCELNTDNNKLKAIVDDTTPRLLWTENLYPYFYEQGISHNLIWYLDEKVEKNVLEEFIEKHIGNDKEYIYWENPPHLKSIPDLDHYQIISVDMNSYMQNIKHLKYVSSAYKWEVFVNNNQIVRQHKGDGEYGWSERVCRRYLQETEETKRRFNSLGDADLRRYFQCKVKKDEFGVLEVDNEEKKDNEMEYDHDKYVFVSDRYHFYLEQGLKQYLLVIRDQEKWENDKIKQIIKAELQLEILGKKNENKFVFWERSQNETQPANLWYYHVIYNDKKRT